MPVGHDPEHVPVTRIEVLDFVAEAFDDVPTERARILEVATRNGARHALLDALRRLPDTPLSEPAQLWDHLGDVPVDPGR
ncbi:hypothetical protein BJF78_01555 [Pseudonocardia sp. CNS-139]|nr:hypothetical protein BJF78_01555 [Pseudonocardia sp. CNS-139]